MRQATSRSNLEMKLVAVKEKFDMEESTNQLRLYLTGSLAKITSSADVNKFRAGSTEYLVMICT